MKIADLKTHVLSTALDEPFAFSFIATIPPAPLALKPIEPMLEYDQSAHPFRQDLIRGAIRMEQGRVRVPDGPGFGIDIDRDVIDRYKQNAESRRAV